MTITLNGTTGITLPNGSASAPAATGSDTDTGIVYGTNTVQIATGGTTAVTVDSSQNVGIGTSSPSGRLHVQNSAGTHTQIWGTTGLAGSYAYMRLQRNTSDGTFTFGTAQAGFSAIAFATSNSSDEQFVERMRITTDGLLQFNSGYGSVATAYGCRAWVNFNGTGTVAIRASGNVSSITDNGTANFTVNFTNSMPDTDYSVVGTCGHTTTSGTTNACRSVVVANAGYATGSVNVITQVGTGSAVDMAYMNVSIFR